MEKTEQIIFYVCACGCTVKREGLFLKQVEKVSDKNWKKAYFCKDHRETGPAVSRVVNCLDCGVTVPIELLSGKPRLRCDDCQAVQRKIQKDASALLQRIKFKESYNKELFSESYACERFGGWLCGKVCIKPLKCGMRKKIKYDRVKKVERIAA